MSTDPPLEARQIAPAMHWATFRDRLLGAGSDGVNDFKLVQQAFPIESVIFDRAITEIAVRLENSGVGSEAVRQEIVDAKRLLALTLVPFLEAFFDRDPPEHDEAALARFRQLARPWAMAQLKSCTAYVTSLAVCAHRRTIEQELVTKTEAARLRELGSLIAEVEARPEAKDLVRALRREYEELVNSIARRRDVDPVVPKSLSYLLLVCTRGGLLQDVALAALIMRGNSSPGANAVRNPLQLLEVDDVASLLGMTNAAITNNVSKLRSKAMNHPDMGEFQDDLDIRHLWVFVEPVNWSNIDQVHPHPDQRVKKEDTHGR